MTPSHRPLLLGALSLLLVSGCEMNSPWGSSGTGSDYGSNSAVASNGGTGSGTGTGTATGPVGVGGESGTSGSDDSVVATASVAAVSVAVGANQTISITFNSSDGLAITGFGISGSWLAARRLERTGQLHLYPGGERQRLCAQSDVRADGGRQRNADVQLRVRRQCKPREGARRVGEHLLCRHHDQQCRCHGRADGPDRRHRGRRQSSRSASTSRPTMAMPPRI